jgi:hypothetical protein
MNRETTKTILRRGILRIATVIVGMGMLAGTACAQTTSSSVRQHAKLAANQPLPNDLQPISGDHVPQRSLLLLASSLERQLASDTWFFALLRQASGRAGLFFAIMVARCSGRLCG